MHGQEPEVSNVVHVQVQVHSVGAGARLRSADHGKHGCTLHSHFLIWFTFHAVPVPRNVELDLLSLLGTRAELKSDGVVGLREIYIALARLT